MKYRTRVLHVDMDGDLEGTLELEIIDVLPPLRLTTFVLEPMCLNLNQAEQEEFFCLGKESSFEFTLFSYEWTLQEGQSRLIQQPFRGSYESLVYGRVTRMLEDKCFELDCGLLVQVDRWDDQDCPDEGQWIAVRGTFSSFMVA